MCWIVSLNRDDQHFYPVSDPFLLPIKTLWSPQLFTSPSTPGIQAMFSKFQYKILIYMITMESNGWVDGKTISFNFVLFTTIFISHSALEL